MYITNNIGDIILTWRTPDSVVNHSPHPILLYVLFIVVCRSFGTMYSFHSRNPFQTYSLCGENPIQTDTNGLNIQGLMPQLTETHLLSQVPTSQSPKMSQQIPVHIITLGNVPTSLPGTGKQ